MSEFPIQADDVRRLAQLAARYGLSELEFVDGDLRIHLLASPDPPVAALPVGATHERGATTPALSGTPIEAPIMGIFYRATAPGEPPLVDIGDTVEVGQPIGVIEAMKVFSEVLAETAGRVTAIPAANGKLVQPGDTLVLLDRE